MLVCYVGCLLVALWILSCVCFLVLTCYAIGDVLDIYDGVIFV